MATITEDYVSFETAKLLKEKGFDVPCNCYGVYNGVNLTYGLCITNKYTNWNKHTDKRIISCPTLQMAMKWLREVHNIFFNVNYFHIDVGNKWACLTIWLPYKNGCEYSIEGFDIETIYEAAIKYCLENLI